jgi:Na+/proline symporter
MDAAFLLHLGVFTAYVTASLIIAGANLVDSPGSPWPGLTAVAGFIGAAIVAAALSASLNAMAAASVNDFYVPFVRPVADDRSKMRVARGSTVAWGLVQLGVAIGAQWMDRSVLDIGLSVLSLAAGPVLGAFLVGVLTRDVGGRPMLIGMITGIVVLFWIWWTGAIAWTWYAFVGASVTGLTAMALSRVLPAKKTSEVFS